MKFIAKGIIPALVTPMNEDGTLKESALRKLLDHVIMDGVHGVFIISSTGESYGLSKEEKRKAIEVTVDHVARRVPVYAGTGAVTTRETIELTQMAEECGVDAVSIVTPYFITPTQKELAEHYKAIARNTGLPVILYNNVGRTGLNIDVTTVERLAEVKNIVGIKDSSGNMTQAAEYVRLTKDKEFNVLMGRDTLIFGGLCYGAAGAIASCANIAPKLCVSIYDKFISGDIKGAREAQFDLAPLRVAFELGTFPVVIKEALKIIGIDTGVCLSPITPLDEAIKQKLKEILEEMKLINK